MEPTVLTTNFAEVASKFCRDEATGEELSRALEHTILFCRRGDEVGFMAFGDEGEGWIQMYSSDLALARAEGACPWFSAPASDLLALVPAGYGVVFDRGSDSEVSVPSDAISRLEPNGA
jgi:hypothetical protein